MKPHRSAPFLLLLLLLLLSLTQTLSAQIGFVTTSYHGVTSATHQTQFNLLSGQGYRMISLTVSGGRANARYSAVWQQVGGPNWVASHDMSHAQYVAQSNSWQSMGYRPKLLTASGVDNDVVFAAMWVNDGVDAIQNIDQATSAFNNQVASERDNGRRLTACGPYEWFGTDRIATIFEPDNSGIAWGALGNDDGTAFNNNFSEFVVGHGRPSLLVTSDTQRYTHVWRDDRVGNWVSVTGRTSSQFTADKALYSGQGLTLTCIAASGSGAAARFGGIFQERLSPYARSHSRTGTAVIPMSGFDSYVETMMENHMVRNASIAVAKNGRLVYTRGYTWAEPGEFATQPTTPFRIGSISKPLCSTVVHDLISSSIGGFGLSTSLVNYLGINPYTSAAQNATVLRLLRHTSGMMSNPDPFVALAAINPPVIVLPVDESYIIRYVCTQPFGPVDEWSYSNAGNTALGQIVEHATGQPYMTVLRNRLFTPVGSNALYQEMARPDDFAPGEAPYHMPDLHLLPSDLHMDRRLQSAQYARDYWDCAGGVVCSAVTLARVVSGAFCIGDDSPSLSPAARAAALVRGTFPKVGGGTWDETDGSWFWDNDGGGRYLYWHDGATDGFGAMCVFTTDGLCLVVLTNMSSVYPSDTGLVAKADLVTNWPTNDLFPSYGLPSFARTPQLTTAVTASVPNVSDTPLVYDGEGLDQVTSVNFGINTITSESQNDWTTGWFVRVSPTRLEIHPPQGLLPSIYSVRANSAQGQGNSMVATLTRSLLYAVKAPDTIQNGHPFAAIVSRGLHPDLSLAILTFSPDLSPSVVPGLVDLGIGNMFSSLTISDARQFTTAAGAVRWDLPTIAGMPQVHFQAVLFDPFQASPWPLPATPVETVVRVP